MNNIGRKHAQRLLEVRVAALNNISARQRTVVDFTVFVMQKRYALAILPASYEENGGGEIRTHEAFRPSGFQDRRDQPLCHPSGKTVDQWSVTKSRCATIAGSERFARQCNMFM